MFEQPADYEVQLPVDISVNGNGDLMRLESAADIYVPTRAADSKHYDRSASFPLPQDESGKFPGHFVPSGAKVPKAVHDLPRMQWRASLGNAGRAEVVAVSAVCLGTSHASHEAPGAGLCGLAHPGGRPCGAAQHTTWLVTRAS